MRNTAAENLTDQIAGMYVSGMSLSEIAGMVEKGVSTVRYHVSKAGALRSRESAIRLASQKGKLSGGMRGKKRVFSEQHKKNISIARSEWGLKNAVGFSMKPSGYYEVTVGKNKGKGVHRVIMEAILGRELLENEVVHHNDGNPSNNDPRNLSVMTEKEHLRLHRKMDMGNRKRRPDGTLTAKGENECLA